ncbi:MULTISPECIES: heavy metal sensor histidine kinase [Variovorax]|uniref:heavy metal sensor histidine kinase n=1 Tax=Variovorax TaxID=34072 RepID=UPI0009EC647C|nr:heavy metal sensor histidine kinase [Variovorax boronicumulans]GER21253.1 two-component sensor histidine kinase [Variovorax boronicumulans]
MNAAGTIREPDATATSAVVKPTATDAAFPTESTGSIQVALSRWFAAQALIGLSLVCVAIYAVTAWSFQVKQTSEFERQSELIKHLIQESRDDPGRDGLRHKLDDFFSTHAEISLVLRRGDEAIYSSRPTRASAHWLWTPTEEHQPQPGDAAMQLQLGIDIQEDTRLLNRLAWTLVGAVVLGSLLIALTGALLVRRGLKPLKKLIQQTAATGPAHPGRRIDPSPYASEITPWVVQFNAVLDRAEQAYQQLESFNADVAHELRTPLANLIGMVEVELARPRSIEELRDALLSALEEARRVSAIVIDMLFLSHADRGAVARRSTPVSLADQVRTVLDFHEATLEDAGLKVHVSGDAHIGIDAGLVRRALSNLLSNASRYAAPGSTIAVVIDTQPDGVWVKVANRGEPVPVDVLPNLFKRFFRAERSRTDSSEHHGLGLAIVAAIARMHGGQTRATSRSGITEISFSMKPEG